jgi:hypothetical protein
VNPWHWFRLPHPAQAGTSPDVLAYDAMLTDDDDVYDIVITLFPDEK